MSENKITIAEIAAKANVSKSTVSRILSGNTPVTADKRTAVEQAMAELNYRPNIFAQSLASGQSMTIGVLTQNFGSPVYDAILRGILQGLNGTGYSPLFADGRWEPDNERQAIETLLDRRVDGLVVLGGLSADSFLQEIANRVPLCIIGRNVPQLQEACLYVDDCQGGYDATQYLIQQGHRQIVHITGILSHSDAQLRLAGFRQALQDAGLPLDEELIVEGNFRRQSGALAVEMMMTRGRPFSAIFAANDQMAFGARLALYRRGIRVPDDISIIGFDDQPDSAFMTPPLTTMRQPAETIGQRAAATILARIKGQPVENPAFRAELIIRESVIGNR